MLTNATGEHYAKLDDSEVDGESMANGLVTSCADGVNKHRDAGLHWLSRTLWTSTSADSPRHTRETV